MMEQVVYLVQGQADAARLRKVGAGNVLVVGEPANLADKDVILIAQSGGREQLIGMNLGRDGRFIDLDGQTLTEYLEGRSDLLALLEQEARDIFWDEERPLSQWDVQPPKPGVSSGFSFLDPYLKWSAPGEYETVVIAGPYGCGKSSFARLLAYAWADNVGRKAGLRASIVGWEDTTFRVKHEVERYALTTFRGNRARNGQLTSEQAARIVDMQDRVGWTQRLRDQARLLSWYHELVEHRATRRRGRVGFFVFDPFNQHHSSRKAHQTETEYIAEVMQAMHELAQRLGVIIVIVAHVSAKSYDETGKIKPFRVANAAGSVQFGNRADRGICILKTTQLKAAASVPASHHMVLHFDKHKNEEDMGQQGTIACVFNPQEMRLVLDQGATVEAQKAWA